MPIVLVVSQPDLGTSILIAASGLIVLWLAGLNIRYFVYSGLILLVSFPFVISFLKPYQKLRILSFFNPDRDPLGAGYQIIQSKIAVGSGGLTGQRFSSRDTKLFGVSSLKNIQILFLHFFLKNKDLLGLYFFDNLWNTYLQNYKNWLNLKKLFWKIVLLWFWFCNFYIYCCQYVYGFRFTPNSWISITNYVLRWIIDARYNDRFKYCYEY